MAANINLFPPIMLDSMPAFIRTSQCRVYFALSNYNSTSDIKNVQVTLVNLSSNKSALKKGLYPSDIKIATLQTDTTKLNQGDEYCYYVNISPSDLQQQGGFGLNQFYKVQLRFTSQQASNPPSSGGLATWLTNNINYFSEWSSTCLIKGIAIPTIALNGLTQESISDLSDLSMLTGQLLFNDNNEMQYLKNYRIKIYIDDTLLWNSDTIYANTYATNQINTPIPYKFNTNTIYTLKFSYTTNNLYTETDKSYLFTISGGSNNPLHVTIAAAANQNIGGIQVDIKGTSGSSDGTFVIRRASSRSNFTLYDDIKFIDYSNQRQIDYTLKDVTIESGIWYKYEVSKVVSNTRGTPVEMDDPIMCVFESMFLTTKDAQLKIQFNPTVSDFKYNVIESQQTTLGSQFPYIRRNGNTYYKSFSMGGLITFFSNIYDQYDFFETENDTPNDRIFISKDEIYGNSKLLYQDYNWTNEIINYEDFIYQKAFREKVYDFLYNNDVKLFRSATEGNILIKLMNIGFQPAENLGRKIYSFTATATEIDENSFSNYLKYNITSQTD